MWEKGLGVGSNWGRGRACWWWHQRTSCLVGSYVLFTGKCNFPLGLFLPFCLNFKPFWSDFNGESRLFPTQKTTKFDYCSCWYGLHCAFVFSSVSTLLLWVTFIRIHVFIPSSSHKVTLKYRTCNLTLGRVRVTIVAMENQQVLHILCVCVCLLCCCDWGV